MDTSYSTKNHPIPFNIKKINSGMEYNNGVFLILEPGYYRIITHLKSRDKDLKYNVIKNSRDGLIYTKTARMEASSTHYIAYLDTFDMISVELWDDSGYVGVAWDCNLVQIEKIN